MQTLPTGSDHALGWAKIATPYGTVLTHEGSNLRFTAHVSLVPEEDWGFVIVTNLGVGMAAPTIGAAVEAMAARHFGPEVAAG